MVEWWYKTRLGRIGEEGKGLRYRLDGLKPEPIPIAAAAIGIGRNILRRIARYAQPRASFQRPKGQNQSMQHSLAVNWTERAAVRPNTRKAAWLYDSGRACGIEANAAKYLAAEAGFDACK